MLPKKGYYIPRLREMDMVPSIWNNFSESGMGTQKWHGVRMKYYKVFFVHRLHIAVYKETEWKSVVKSLLNKFIKKPGYFNSIWQENLKIGKITEKFASLTVNKIKTSRQNVLFNFLINLKKHWIYFDQVNVLPWFVGAEPLREYLTKTLIQKYRLSMPEIEILFAPDKLSLTAEEEIQVLKSALKYQLTGKLPALAKNLSKNFGWIPFGYDGPTYWDKGYYENKIQKYSKTSPKKLKVKIQNITSQNKKNIQHQKQLLKTYAIDTHTQRLLNIQQKLYILTDIRKKVHFKTNFVYHQVLNALTKPCGLTLHELKYLDAEEIRQMFGSKAFNKYRDLSTNRQNSIVCGYVANGKKEVILVGNQAEKMLGKYTYLPKVSNEIKGMVANKVGGGITKGRIKKITNPREMASMKKGEILVTWMTTPDFVPAMRKAKAIVTDEGGITSHAAIVSRELGIPCIIGTKLATKVFKDGDLVEVDANKGIVKKLNP